MPSHSIVDSGSDIYEQFNYIIVVQSDYINLDSAKDLLA